MKYLIIGLSSLAVVIIVTVIIVLLMLKKKSKKNKVNDETYELSNVNNGFNDLELKVEMLPIEKIPEDSNLVEITDSTVLSRINNVIPSLGQAAVSVGNLVASKEVLYRAVIPAGEKLAKSKSIEGAVRGIYHGKNGIKGHANLIQVKNGASVAMNAASSVMSVASMVVGQYYMAQIQNELKTIENKISKVSNFQNNEFASRVLSLITHIKAISDFRTEILENDELRLSKINQIDSLEEECTQLLGQANITVASFEKKNNLKYEDYVVDLIEAKNWSSYQDVLLQALYQLSELRFTLHLGKVSREQCATILKTYQSLTLKSKETLPDWNQHCMNKLGIDLDENIRKRKGIDGAIHFLPGLFKKDLNYRMIDENIVDTIKTQMSSKIPEYAYQRSNLYNEDVQIISKGGKLYYLAMDNENN